MKGILFFLIALVVVVLDVVVPYAYFATTARFGASFLYWCVITLAMIIFAFFATRKWRNQ